MKLASSLFFLVVSSAAVAQGGPPPPTARDPDLRGMRLQSDLTDGGLERDRVVVVALVADLGRRYDLSPVDGVSPVDRVGSWWIAKEVVNGAPSYPLLVHPAGLRDVNHRLVLDVPSIPLGLRTGDRLRVFLEATRKSDGQRVLVTPDEDAVEVTLAEAPSRALKLSVGSLAYAPSQSLENGSRSAALLGTVKAGVSNLLPNRTSVRYSAESENRLSTQGRDKDAYLSATLGALGYFGPSRVGTAKAFAKVLSAESFDSGSFKAGASLSLPVLGAVFRLGSVLDAYQVPTVTLVPAEFVRRYRRETDVSPWHAASDLAESSLAVEWAPILLFPRGVPGEVERDPSLRLSAQGWYFPGERATGGASVRRFESRADVEIDVPAARLGIQRWLPATARLAVTYSTGAVEAQNFARSTSFNVGLKWFWQ